MDKDSTPMIDETPLPPQTLLFYFDDWKQRGLRVMTSDEKTQLYHVDLRLRKPNVTVFRCSPADSRMAIATASFHHFSNRIETEMRGQPITLSCKGKRQAEYEYSSPAFNNQTVTWSGHSQWTMGDAVCLDENKLTIARMVPKCALSKKAGRLEFTEDMNNLSQDAVDEIVAAGLSIYYYKYLTSPFPGAS